MSVWDAGTADGSLNCYVTMSVPAILLLLRFVCVIRLQGERQGSVIFLLLLDSLNGCSDQCWTRPKPGAVASSVLPTWVSGTKYLGHHLLPSQEH